MLGLSGFETGVSMMPLVAADGQTPTGAAALPHPEHPQAAHRARPLIMSVYLIATSFVTTVLIPAEEFEAGGEANGRALAYLAHEQFGDGVRHRLRHQHHPHPLVRRSVGHGRA